MFREKADAFWAHAGAIGWAEVPRGGHIVGICESSGGRIYADGGEKTQCEESGFGGR